MRHARLLTFLSLSMVSLIAFSGCSSGKLSAVEYNNAVVQILNDTSAAIEETTQAYDKSVPNVVTEESEVDVEALKAARQEALSTITLADQVVNLKSQEESQQMEVKQAFVEYTELATNYLSSYQEMISYYENKEFVENLDKVAVYDEELHAQYNEFIAANNTLVDILGKYVK